MKAMILAAGRGDRMRPLTNQIPKPLLKVKGKALIQYSIEKLVRAGFKEIVINVAYLASQIMETLGDGEQFGIKIIYTNEGNEGLETAGGIINALPLLGDEAFIVINCDVACDFPLETLKLSSSKLAHLILVNNPEFNLQGDFSLAANGRLSTASDNRYTFTGIGIYSPKLFENYHVGKLKLGPILKLAADNGNISGELFKGLWMDIGTPQRLQALDHYVKSKNPKIQKSKNQ